MTGSEQVALVAGGTGAIGGAVIELLVEQGWTVVATHRTGSPHRLDGVRWVKFDGALNTDTTHLRAELTGVPGLLRAVVCTIGAASSKRSIVATDPSEFGAVFDGNVTSVVRLWQAVHERARAGKAGVVLLGSDTTTTLSPCNGAYSAAKAALEAFAATLAAEEAQHRLRANVLSPSLIESPLAEHILELKGVTRPSEYYAGLPWGRALRPHEVAAVAYDVVTNAHWDYMSGQTIRLASRSGR